MVYLVVIASVCLGRTVVRSGARDVVPLTPWNETVVLDDDEGA